MCGGALGLARTLNRTMPRRKPSFYKRHPECLHKSARPGKRVKVKFTRQPDKRLIYYSEGPAYPTGVHHKLLYVMLAMLSTPLALAGMWLLVNAIEVGILLACLFSSLWLAVLVFMGMQCWCRQPKPYRRPMDRSEIEPW